jgi:tetratricopeptide (TPR) repeat protein
VDPSLLRLRLATCLADLGEKGKVAELVNKACADTDNPYYLREGARQFFSLGQYARAKELFERAYKVSGSDAESAYALSLFLMRVPDAAMRNIELAGIYVEQAVTAEPDNARFISAMAEAAWARGDKEKARTLAEQALKLAPDSYAIRKQAEAYKAE